MLTVGLLALTKASFLRLYIRTGTLVQLDGLALIETVNDLIEMSLQETVNSENTVVGGA